MESVDGQYVRTAEGRFVFQEATAESTPAPEISDKKDWIKDGFTMVSNEAMRGTSVSATARLIYILIISRFFEKDYSFPSLDTLAQEVGLSSRQIRRYIQELETNKWLDIDRQSYWPNEYRSLKKIIKQKWVLPKSYTSDSYY